MKKAYLVLFTSLVTAASFGQSIHRAVFNSIGANISNGQTKMILSVGEPIIGIAHGSGVILGQGFLGGDIKNTTTPTTGVENITADNAEIYPNPFTKTVKIKSDIDNMQVAVYNTMGQEVYNGTYPNEGMDLSYLSPGLYMVHAMSNDKLISNTKILKQ